MAWVTAVGALERLRDVEDRFNRSDRDPVEVEVAWELESDDMRDCRMRLPRLCEVLVPTDVTLMGTPGQSLPLCQERAIPLPPGGGSGNF
jgi:hypothetical protein